MTRRIALVTAVAALSAVVAARPLPPQAASQPLPDITFTVEVNYVEVDAVVTDATGAPVTDLTAGDFELLEDGTPQKLSAFSFVNVPIERRERPLFAARPVEADVFSNSGTEGRLYLLVLDDLHTAAARTGQVRRLGREFIERHFGANDYAAVVFTGGRDVDGQDFTNNPRLLLAAIDRFIGLKLASATIAKSQVLNSIPQNSLARAPVSRGSGSAGGNRAPASTNPNDPNLIASQPDDPLAYERSARAQLVMGRVRQLAEFMAGVRGRRKAMLLVGEGVEYDIDDVFGSSAAAAVAQETDDAIAAATRGNMSIYAIDPRVVQPIDDELLTGTNSTVAEDVGLGMASLRHELSVSQASLRFLASGTGGFAAVNRSDFGKVFDQIVRENSSYYMLGYSPANERRDGKYRRIQIRVKRPGLRVTRGRNGYTEEKSAARTAVPASGAGGQPTPIAMALTSPLPLSGLPLRVFAATYKAREPQAAVALAIEIDVRDLDFEERDGTFVQHLDVTHVAVDPGGVSQQLTRQPVDLAFTKEALERARLHGVRLVSAMTLKPGRYQLRVAVAGRSGRMGSVIRDLEIPDYTAAPLSMSGISMTSTSALDTPTTARADLLRRLLHGPPTASREFTQTDEIYLYAEVYENVTQPQHMLELRTRARAEGGRIAFDLSEQVWSHEQKGRLTYAHSARIPISDLAPGSYVIEMEAQSRMAPMRTVKREIEIRVRE